MSSKDIHIGYVNVEVRNLSQAVPFYRDLVGLPLSYVNEEFGYASFETPGGLTLGIVQVKDTPGKRHTGIGLMVDDLDAAYAQMKADQVVFQQPPTKEEWGGYMAIFEDPEGNVFYLDQNIEHETEATAVEPELSFELDTHLTAGTIKDD